jgi:nucleoside-diphosphate-sugar epimerase
LHEDTSHGGRAYFISQERPVPLWWFIGKILQIYGLKPIEKNISASMALRIGSICEFVYGLFNLETEPPMTRFVALQLSTSHYFNQSAAIQELHYHPQFSIEDGLKDL